MAEGNGYATREQLLTAGGKRRFRDVTLPVSELKVRVQSLTEKELSAYQGAVVRAGGRTQIQYIQQRLLDAGRRLIGMCLVDGEGNRMLMDNEIDRLGEMDSADSQHLYTECANHCGINLDDIEELAKNSAAMAAVDSPTA